MMYYYYLLVMAFFWRKNIVWRMARIELNRKFSQLQTLRGKKPNIVVYTIYLENHDDDGVLEEVKQTIL